MEDYKDSVMWLAGRSYPRVPELSELFEAYRDVPTAVTVPHPEDILSEVYFYLHGDDYSLPGVYRKIEDLF
jgi:hypothetical protein